MKNNHKIFDYRTYWILKKRIVDFSHKFNIIYYKLRNSINREKDRFAVLKNSLYSISLNIFRAFLFVVFLYLIEYISNFLYLKENNNLPEEINYIINLIPVPKYPSILDSVVSLISLLASITGVLLALFYPVLATIASTAYSKVNSSIRNLLFMEPSTQKYMRDLAFITAYSVWVLLFIAFGFNPGSLILFILSLYCLYSLFNLLKLGTGVYNLFEPNTLILIVSVDIFKNINQVMIGSLYWNNNSFQDYFRRQVEKKVNDIRLINELSYEGIASNHMSLKDTMEQTFGIINRYLSQKKKIPVDSKWFKEDRYHKSYFEASMSEQQLAHDTEKYMVFKNEKNYLWLEDKLIDIYKEIGEKISLTENQKTSYEYINQSSSSLLSFGYIMEYDLAEKLLSINFDLTKKVMDFKTEKTYPTVGDNLILVENFISICFGNYVTGIFRRIEQFNQVEFDLQFDSINWKDKETIYKLNVPLFLYTYFEDYFNKINKEVKVENRIMTPNWYIKQHLTAEYLLKTKNGFERLVSLLPKFILKLVLFCNANKDGLTTSFATHTAIDVLDRLNYILHSIEVNLKTFNKNNFLKDSFKWSEIEYLKIKEVLDGIREKLILICAQNIEEVSKIEWNKDYPDVFSHSYLLISKQLEKCLYEGDLEFYKKIFPQFVCSINEGYVQVKKRYSGHYNSEQEIVYQLHIELMQICGISYIYSKLHEVPFWDFTLEVLKSQSFEEREINEFFSSYMFFKYVRMGTGINFTHNFKRRVALEDFLKLNSIEKSKGDDMILDYYINRYNVEDDFEEIFIEFYLATFIEAKKWIEVIQKDGRRNLFDYIFDT